MPRPSGEWTAIDATAEPARDSGPRRWSTPGARVAVALTLIPAAVVTAWSLRIAPGDPMFYPATFGIGAVYLIGALLAAGVERRRPPLWPENLRELWIGALAGATLLVIFLVGGFAVHYIPFLRDPVLRLLEHAQQGSVTIIAVATIVSSLAEELYYRGALWAVLPPRWRVVATSAIYALITAVAGIALLALAAAVLGALTAWLRARSHSLVPPMVAHLIWSLGMLLLLPYAVG